MSLGPNINFIPVVYAVTRKKKYNKKTKKATKNGRFTKTRKNRFR